MDWGIGDSLLINWVAFFVTLKIDFGRIGPLQVVESKMAAVVAASRVVTFTRRFIMGV